MRTLEAVSVHLSPIVTGVAVSRSGMALVGYSHGDGEIVDEQIRDFLFTPYGLMAMIRFDSQGGILSRSLSAGTYEDLLAAGVEALARKAGLTPEDEADWDEIAEMSAMHEHLLDEPTLIGDLADERIHAVPHLQNDIPFLQRIVSGQVTVDEIRGRSLQPCDYDAEMQTRESALIVHHDWLDVDETGADMDADIAREIAEHGVALLGRIDDDVHMHSIGLAERGWDEICVRDVDSRNAPYLLRMVIATLEDAGAVPQEGRLDIVPGGLRLRRMDQSDAVAIMPRAVRLGRGVLEVLLPE